MNYLGSSYPTRICFGKLCNNLDQPHGEKQVLSDMHVYFNNNKSNSNTYSVKQWKDIQATTYKNSINLALFKNRLSKESIVDFLRKVHK